MKSRAAAVAAVLFNGAMPAAAEAPVVGDERAVSAHLSQAEIEAGLVDTPTLIEVGRQLFTARFTRLDGAGRPTATAAEVPTHRPLADTPTFFRTSGPDANACSGCHVQPVAGGAGDFVANVFVAPQDIEYDFDTITPDLSMERGTTALQGAGLLELLAREMTADLHAIREAALAEARATGAEVKAPLVTKGVSFGAITARPDGFVDTAEVVGIHHDLVVKPFSQKAVIISLRQFANNAFNNHHGMQPDERFGPRWTGVEDFDEDGFASELTAGDITAATLFQATLPPPVQVFPEDAVLRAAAERGAALFEEIGCASCHIPALPLESAVFVEPGPYNPAGTLRDRDVQQTISVDLAGLWGEGVLERDAEGRYLVRAFTDLRRHRIADGQAPFFANELITQNFVPRDQFRTAPLWGVGSTAPYGHRGDVGTLTEAILHHGGEAAEVRQAFEALPAGDRGAIVEFLKSLRIAPDDGGAGVRHASTETSR
jgi:mono/diheme cytochrome c family protein